MKLHQVGKFGRAAKACREILDRDPHHANALDLLDVTPSSATPPACAFHDDAQLKEAIFRFEKSVEIVGGGLLPHRRRAGGGSDEAVRPAGDAAAIDGALADLRRSGVHRAELTALYRNAWRTWCTRGPTAANPA